MTTLRIPLPGTGLGIPSPRITSTDVDVSTPRSPVGRWRRRERLPLSALRTREVQKRFAVIFAAKAIGLSLVVGFMSLFAWFFSTAASADTGQAAAKVANTISPINTMWVLVAAFLVFFMQAGFMALEAGFARSRESVNIMMECIFDTCLCGVLYYAVGFAFQFGQNWHGVIGVSKSSGSTVGSRAASARCIPSSPPWR